MDMNKTHLEPGQKFVSGRSKEIAVDLLKRADERGIPQHAILTTSDGFIVPEELLQEAGKQYDPADYTVDEVQEYLDGADEEERERVLALERKGKNRKAFQQDAETEKENG